jgi:carbamate kinase
VLGIASLIILTAIPNVAIHYGKPHQQALDRVTIHELRAFQAQQHFAAGSMGAKVEAAIRFLEGGGERVIIAHVNDLMPALRGEAGTLIVADDA